MPGYRDFDQAQEDCRSRGTELASLHSAEDTARAMALRTGSRSTWIGTTQRSGIWQNADGTPLDYTNWNTGEPNGGNGIRSCVWMRGDVGNWNDDACTAQSRWVDGHFCNAPCASPSSPLARSQPQPVPEGECDTGSCKDAADCAYADVCGGCDFCSPASTPAAAPSSSSGVGWRLGGHGGSCTEACEAAGLRCDNIALQLHWRADVHSNRLQSNEAAAAASLIESLSSTPIAMENGVCAAHLSVGSRPEFKSDGPPPYGHSECRINTPGTINPPVCDIPAGATPNNPSMRNPDWQRLCYCSS